MLHLICFGFPGQADPTAMEIGGFCADPCIDQHLRGFYVECLDRNPIPNRTDTGKHLAADFPSVMSTAPWVGEFGAGQRGAYRINVFTGHGG